MQFELKEDWQVSGGPPGNPGAVIIPAGTLLGEVTVTAEGKMTEMLLADAIITGRAIEHRLPDPTQQAKVKKTLKQAVTTQVQDE